MNMERKIVKKLLKWKDMKLDRMPLLLYGARQVGKSYILKEFGNEYYKNKVVLDFEKDAKLKTFFENDLSPDKIIKLIEGYFNVQIVPEDTLVIFDEIQACERALTSLKYFAEDAPEYHVIGAGSLLGVAINREKFSFPVGKVIMETLYPLDFEEFLLAHNETVLMDMIKEHFENFTKMPFAWHEKALEYYRLYTLTRRYASSN